MDYPSEIERRIVEAIEPVPRESRQALKELSEELPASEWTRRAKNGVGGIAHDFHFIVRAGTCDCADAGEWLYDMAWFESDKEGCLVNVPLIMEIQWGPQAFEEVQYDFRKLLIGRSRYKVMVFEGKNVESKIDKLVKEVKGFKLTQPGDRYLFMAFNMTEKPWSVHEVGAPRRWFLSVLYTHGERQIWVKSHPDEDWTLKWYDAWVDES